jgi:hypothetical protein
MTTVLAWFGGCLLCLGLFVLLLQLDARRLRRERPRFDLLWDDDDPEHIDDVLRRETAIGVAIRARERNGKAA